MATTNKNYVSEANMKQFCERFKEQFAPKTSQGNGNTTNNGITEANVGIIEDVNQGFGGYIYFDMPSGKPVKYLEITDGFGTLFIWYNGNVLHEETFIENSCGYIDVEDHRFYLSWSTKLDIPIDLHWKAFA